MKADAEFAMYPARTTGYLKGFETDLDPALVEQNGDESSSSVHCQGMRPVF
jgi:hypothetical protein